MWAQPPSAVQPRSGAKIAWGFWDDATAMRILLFTQPGCLSCELMRVYLEAREIAFEEHDITADSVARRLMMETYASEETPTLVIFAGPSTNETAIQPEVLTGFDPALLDQLLDAAPSSE